MTTPAISIIVPVYKAENTLHRCVDSILAQTFTDFELLLIDDGSPDRSGAICDECSEKDPRVRAFHKRNGGVSSARNVGLDNARGEWIAFVDADDWTEKNQLKVLYENVMTNNLDIVLCGFKALFGNQTHNINMPSIADDKIQFLHNYVTCHWTVVWNSLIKNTLISDNNLSFCQSMRIGEDFHFMFQLLFFAERIGVTNDLLYIYDGRNADSAIRSMHFEDYKEIIRALSATMDFIRTHGDINKFDKLFSWKILIAKQDLVLYPDMHDEFLKILPETHKHIASCPYINTKIKLMMWLLTHHMGWMTKVICRLRFRILGASSSEKY